ncbi:MAG TPA: glutathione S-transferase N-terminal domain-containing protein [Candidatus Binatia bacterium]|nr:glutathione S-transferase N-terminal domain-containing protein [Candidatus Binatia bacterium]
MTDLSEFPITRRWPPQHPDRIQLYSLNTPNGVKVSIALEELELPYEPHLVNFSKGDQKTSEFRSLNPYAKIPAIIDPNGPDGRPLPLFESGAILLYLAEKTGRLLPKEAQRYEMIKWLFFQVAGVGPIFGQLGFFKIFAGSAIEDRRPLEHYSAESRKLLEVMDAHLNGRTWIMGDAYTIADIAMIGPVRNLIGYYGARDLVQFDTLEHVPAWLERGLARPAVQRGLKIPSRQ